MLPAGREGLQIRPGTACQEAQALQQLKASPWSRDGTFPMSVDITGFQDSLGVACLLLQAAIKWACQGLWPLSLPF